MGLLAKLTGKSHNGSKQNNKAAESASVSKYRGVQIMTYDPDCCQAAKAISKQRFLEKDVPMLPLDGCDAAYCQCTYKRFGDRRTDTRRASDFGFDVASQYRMHNQRSSESSGRRSSDRH